MNCRLPQTPHTPSTAAAYYFDDIFVRPKKGGPKQLRRSSTSRNIGGFLGDEEDARSSRSRLQRANSIGLFDEDALREKEETDQRVAQYVQDKLEQMRDG